MAHFANLLKQGEKESDDAKEDLPSLRQEIWSGKAVFYHSS